MALKNLDYENENHSRWKTSLITCEKSSLDLQRDTHIQTKYKNIFSQIYIVIIKLKSFTQIIL